MGDARSAVGWEVVLDRESCTLCEVCARDCPTGALRVDRTAETVALVFAPSQCDGCPGGTSCQAICPEGAIRLTVTGGGEEVELLRSPLLPCSSCGKGFAPAHKLEALARKGRLHHDLVRDLCPICRRNELVVTFIEEERAPGEKAEYRSTTTILRRAGKLREEPG